MRPSPVPHACVLGALLASLASAQALVPPRLGWSPTPDPTRTIALRVAFPDGTPADEACSLVLEATPPDDVVDRADPGPRLVHSLEQIWYEVDRRAARDGEVAELSLPVAANEARVRLEARYLYLEKRALRVSRPSPEPLWIDAALGAEVRLQLVVPEDSAHDPALLVGATLALVEGRDDPYTAPSPTHRSGRIEGDLTCTVGGVHPGDTLEWGRRGRATLYSPRGGLPLYRAAFGTCVVDGSRRLERQVVLEDLLPVRGRVVDATGRPVAGARVGHRLAGDDGRFALAQLAGLERTYDIDVPGFGRGEVPVSTVGGVRSVDIGDVALARLPPVTGRVVRPDGQPVAGFPLRIVDSLPRARAPVATAETDEQGRFSIEPRLREAALLHGHARIEPEGFEVVVMPRDVAPGATGLELVVERAPRLRAVATFEDGAPLDGVRVMTWCTAVPDPPGEFAHYGNSSAELVAHDGRFEMGGVHAGTWRVFVSAAGCRQIERRVELPHVPWEGADAEPVELVFPRPVTLRGRVSLADGLPAPGAEVSCRGDSNAVGTVVADASGRFEYTGWPADGYRVQATRGELLSGRSGPFDLAPGDSAGPLELVLREAGTLVVRARVPRGGLLPSSCSVVVPSGLRRHADFDDQGYATIDALLPGDYTVEVVRYEPPRRRYSFLDLRDRTTASATVVGGEEVLLVVELGP